MSLTLYCHPLASFCWKVLIALYENGTVFEARTIDLADEAQRAELESLWPICKFPVLFDRTRQRTVPESSIIIEYLAQHHPGNANLVPADPELARETRLRDRFYDLYVHEPMQKIVGDRLRSADDKDTHGVARARAMLAIAYRMVDEQMATNRWAMGNDFSMADCAAAPALFYADLVMPLRPTHELAAAYLERLKERASFSRVLTEAEPYFKLFPK